MHGIESRVFTKLTQPFRVQHTGLKNSFKCRETSTLLHHSNSNLPAQPLGAPDKKQKKFCLAPISRTRNMLIHTGNLLHNEYEKMTFFLMDFSREQVKNVTEGSPSSKTVSQISFSSPSALLVCQVKSHLSSQTLPCPCQTL